MTHTTNEEVDQIAIDLFTSLTAGINTPAYPDFSDEKFTFDPDSDQSSGLYQLPNDITIEDLTSGNYEGTGVFDVLMTSVASQIAKEQQSGRISGDQYAAVFTEAITSVLSNSTQFLLQRDNSKWQAITAQMQARIAEIEATKAIVDLEKVKAETAQTIFEMQNSGAQYALTKLQLASEEARHHNLLLEGHEREFTLGQVLPAQAAVEQYKLNVHMPAETNLVRERWETERAQSFDTRSDGLTPIGGLLGQQKELNIIEIESKETELDSQKYSLTNLLPLQLRQGTSQADLTDEQVEIAKLQQGVVSEQRETERAKTLDTRSDGTSVTGSVGKQKELYSEQINSFVKDAAHKTAKMYLDAWITQKTLDDGLSAPTELQNQAINDVISAVRSNNSL